jgi:hypothetical protein
MKNSNRLYTFTNPFDDPALYPLLPTGFSYDVYGNVSMIPSQNNQFYYVYNEQQQTQQQTHPQQQTQPQQIQQSYTPPIMILNESDSPPKYTVPSFIDDEPLPSYQNIVPKYNMIQEEESLPPYPSYQNNTLPLPTQRLNLNASQEINRPPPSNFFKSFFLSIRNKFYKIKS